MQVVDYNKQTDTELLYEYLKKGPLLLELNSVFAVIALPDQSGVGMINRVKNRLPGKAYGGLIADYKGFILASLLNVEEKQIMLTDELAALFNNCFIRLPWQEDHASQGMTMDGMFQGLILSEPFRSFAASIEQKIIQQENASPFLKWLICSSANISGDPMGSIIQFEKALQFGKDRGIEYMITFSGLPELSEKGSFPIFSFTEGLFRIERDGPGAENIKNILRGRGLFQE
jgi:hypothetical protein